VLQLYNVTDECTVVCYRLRDVILNIAASIIFTCALGLFFIHASVLWTHYQVNYVFIYTDTHTISVYY